MDVLSDIEIFKNTLVKALAIGRLELPAPAAVDKMAAYYNYLAQENKRYNLTRISAPESAAIDHFCDSLMPLDLIGQAVSVIDVGSGAGFPIAPIAAMRPECTAFALEASKKKCAFIKNASEFSGIKIDVINGRAEDLASTRFRESFDVCVSRAVAPLNILMELCSPFVKPGGLFLAYKSGADETVSAAQAAAKLCLKPVCCVYSPVPQNGRKVFAYIKTGALPEKYPRPYPKIKKSPL